VAKNSRSRKLRNGHRERERERERERGEYHETKQRERLCVFAINAFRPHVLLFLFTLRYFQRLSLSTTWLRVSTVALNREKEKEKEKRGCLFVRPPFADIRAIKRPQRQSPVLLTSVEQSEQNAAVAPL
jgi:hypothetical protein